MPLQSLRVNATDIVTPTNRPGLTTAIVAPRATLMAIRPDAKTVDPALDVIAETGKLYGPVAGVGQAVVFTVDAVVTAAVGPKFEVWGIDQQGNAVPLCNRAGDFLIDMSTATMKQVGSATLWRSQLDLTKHIVDAQGMTYMYVRITTAASSTSGAVQLLARNV